MTYAVNAKLTSVDANKMLSVVVEREGHASTERWWPTQRDILHAASGDVIVQTLNGTMAMNLTNGKIMKLDLPGELSKIGKFGGGRSQGLHRHLADERHLQHPPRSGQHQRHEGRHSISATWRPRARSTWSTRD